MNTINITKKTHEEGVAYWLTRPVHERLDALEELREAFIQTLPKHLQEFQRVVRIINRSDLQ